MRSVLANNQVDTQLADKGLERFLATRILHLPNSLGHLTRTAPDTDIDRPGIGLVCGGDYRIDHGFGTGRFL